MRFRCLFALMAIASWGFAVAAHAQALYWLDTSYGAPTLNRADADGLGNTSVALAAGSLPEGLALDAGNKLYWAEGAWSNARIQRAAPTLASITPLVSGGSVFRGIAVDATAGLMYWTSSNLAAGARIQRAALDGSGLITLIVLGAAANPRGIAVDNAGGKLYWADFDQDAIYRANLDGSSPGVWITLPSGSHPYGVAFDPVGQQIYWTEFAGKLRRAPTSTGVSSTLLGGLAQPTYLALDPAGNRMYFSEGGAGVQRIQKATMTGSPVVTLPLPLTTYGGVAFVANASVAVSDSPLPTAFALEAPSPNPGSGPTQVRFALPRDAMVRLSVLDLQGREVAVLADGVRPAGRHTVQWSEARRAIPAGMYFVRLATEAGTWVQRLVRTN